MMRYYGYGPGYNFGYDMMGTLGGVLHLVFWIIIILIIIRVFRGRKGHWHGFVHEKGALDILKERYAKGEINKEEFEEKKRDII